MSSSAGSVDSNIAEDVREECRSGVSRFSRQNKMDYRNAPMDEIIPPRVTGAALEALKKKKREQLFSKINKQRGPQRDSSIVYHENDKTLSDIGRDHEDLLDYALNYEPAAMRQSKKAIFKEMLTEAKSEFETKRGTQ